MQANISARRILLASTITLVLDVSILPAQGQGSLFCPGPGTFNGKSGPGVCVNPVNDLGNAFSTSALSSQSLSEVSQTVTGQSAQAAFAAVRERRDQEAAPPSVRPTAPPPRPPVQDPNSPVVFKATPSSIYAGPSYAVWGFGFGDWERRQADTVGIVHTLVDIPNPVSIDRKMTTLGFLGGTDVTYRTGSSVWMLGLIAGYMSSDVKLTSSALGNTDADPTNASSFSTVHATISGPSVGAYANYANGPLSADLTVKADFMVISEWFNDFYINASSDPIISVNIPGSASVNMINTTVGGNLNYRVTISPTHWWEPTVGFRYTRSDFGSNAAEIGLADGNVFRVQGGLRFGWEQYSGQGMWQTTLTGLAYSDVSVNGLVLNTGGFAGSTVLPSDEGKIRGMGILATKYNNGNGTTLFGQVDVRGGQNLLGVGGRLGARISLN
jgi:hypothetical protein